jgi:hypothetical protein
VGLEALMARLQIDAPVQLTDAEKQEFMNAIKAAGEAPHITMDRVNAAAFLIRYFTTDGLSPALAHTRQKSKAAPQNNSSTTP